MIDKGQWREFGQDTRVTPLLFTRSAVGFLQELQNLGWNLFSICNILNTKQGSGKIVKTILKFIKNSIEYHNIHLDGNHFTLQHRRWRYAPKKLVCDPPINPQKKKTTCQSSNRASEWGRKGI